MNATDELRRLLDERGIETSHDSPVIWKCANGHGACARDYDGALTVQTVMTPQQAIDATLWRGTCHNVALEGEWFECSTCGCVRQLLHPHFCPNCGRKVVDE